MTLRSAVLVGLSGWILLCGSTLTPSGSWLSSAVAVDTDTVTASETSEAAAEEAPGETQVASISYHGQIEPIFRTHCQGCHQPANAQGEFVMTDFQRLLAAGESGEAAIVPSEPDASHLLAQITPVAGQAAMPKQAAPLSESEIDLIRRWIAAGAVDDSPPSQRLYDSSHPPQYARPPLITALAYSPDGKWLAVSGFQEVLLVDTAAQQTVQRLIGLSQRIESINFSPDSSRLAVTGGSSGRLGEVQLWDVATGELLLSQQIGFDTISGGSFSPDGELLAFGCSDNTVRAIDTLTGEQKLHQGAHDDRVAACVFSPDGKHLVSAGRDMTVKLTEVETERFIDNITSITPGALGGGVSALAMHPEREEVLVGGSDGIPKIYRLLRQTERKIGDDANLIRAYPVMPGRIFTVAIGPRGKYLAAASTLDGNSHVAVYPYDSPGEITEELKAVMAKPFAERSAEETKQVNAHLAQVAPSISTLDLAGSRLYAIAFSADGESLALAGSDGQVRIMAVASGELQAEFLPVTLNQSADVQDSQQHLSAGRGRPASSTSLPASDQIELDLLPQGQLTDLSVEPSTIDFRSDREAVQLVITAHFDGGQACDVTRQASISGCEQIEVDATGLVRPLHRAAVHDQPADQPADSALEAGKLQIAWGGMTREIDVAVADLSQRPAVDFTRDVNPLLSRLGCNSGMCHGSQQGKNGFKLSLRGYDPLEDVRALSDDLRSRRLNTSAPEVSLMLLKPLGVVPHEGGALFTADSVYFDTLHSWIAQGAKLQADSQKAARIELSPAKPVIERENGWQQFRVVAHYPDGSSRDVTQEAFIESGNSEVCKSHEGGRIQALRRGEAPILARYEGAYAAATVTVMGDRDQFVWEEPEVYNAIDRFIADKWERMKIAPSPLTNDAEFLRRVRLDLTGLPPSVEEIKSFLADPRPLRTKRAALVDSLIGSPDYVEHWANKWADLLQVNSKFIGSQGASAFRGWIRTAVDENRPYDQFVREVLTASGSNKDNPPASYYKILREPDSIMENTTHLFLGVRFNCNKCHDHPFERWTQDQYYQLSAYFAQTELQPDPASDGKVIGGSAVEGAKPLYEVVADKPTGEMLHVRTQAPVAPSFPYQCDYEVAEGATRRQQLAAWITSADNPYFAKSMVNRLWGYLNGVGLMMPLDDIRAGNPPTNPELLEYLTHEFINSGFDTEHVLRLICNSRTYQLSVAAEQWNRDDTINYSHATPRRLPAEVLYDAVHLVTGAVSDIPGVAPGTRAAALPDVAVQLEDGFLNNLGRPVRESACECERSQELQLGPVMALVSGPTVGKAISDPLSALPTMAKNASLSDEDMVREIYLRVLARPATDAEVSAIIDSAGAIVADHQTVVDQLSEREAWWAKERAAREEERLRALSEAQMAAAARQEAMRPERERMEQERLEKLAAAQTALADYDQQAVALASQVLDDPAQATNWFPLSPSSVTTTNMDSARLQVDRSILVSGNAAKGSYTVTCTTPLRGIRGFRLEALALPSLEGGGPGLAGNGNVVITEIALTAAPASTPDQAAPVAIARGQADFTQGGFAIEQAFDGKTDDQQGWALHPRGGMTHWATFQTQEPIDFEGGTTLSFTIHQAHNAEKHRLAHFRLSVTTDAGDIPLGLPEELAVLRAIPTEERSSETLAKIVDHWKLNDARRQELAQAVTAAEVPLPADAQLVELQQLIASLEKETADDAKLLQMRLNAQASASQLSHRRLTLAQDLTWALINSPAFLFNH